MLSGCVYKVGCAWKSWGQNGGIYTLITDVYLSYFFKIGFIRKDSTVSALPSPNYQQPLGVSAYLLSANLSSLSTIPTNYFLKIKGLYK